MMTNAQSEDLLAVAASHLSYSDCVGAIESILREAEVYNEQMTMIVIAPIFTTFVAAAAVAFILYYSISYFS